VGSIESCWYRIYWTSNNKQLTTNQMPMLVSTLNFLLNYLCFAECAEIQLSCKFDELLMFLSLSLFLSLWFCDILFVIEFVISIIEISNLLEKLKNENWILCIRMKKSSIWFVFHNKEQTQNKQHYNQNVKFYIVYHQSRFSQRFYSKEKINWN
jgi:hypothetical protein